MNEASIKPPTSTLKGKLREHSPVVLVWLCLLVLPIGRVVEVPVMLMAIAGIYLCIRHWRRFTADPACRLFISVFLLAWIPILMSLPDAVRPESTAMMSINHLRFAFSGLFILYALSTPDAHRRFLALCAWLLLFWVVDGIVQLVVGRDLFGFPPALYGNTPNLTTRVNALFGREGLVYGILLAVLCPLLWEYAGRRWSSWVTAAVVVATTLAVLAAGTRSAWISVIVILLAYGVVLWRRHGVFPTRLVAAVAVAGIVAVAGLSAASDKFSSRIENLVGTITGSTSIENGSIGNNSIGHRIWIWRAALRMIDDNTLNGVGAGGFRYAYEAYADHDDPLSRADPPIRPYHTHQLWLETLAETGIVGAVGLFALLTMMVMAGIGAPRQTRRIMLPYGLCLLAAYFPFNTHMAIYSSFWSQIVWWLIALYCAGYGAALTGSALERPDPST